MFTELLLAISALSGLEVFAADTAPTAGPAFKTIDLSGARQTAFSNNWNLLAAKSDVDIATAQRFVASEFPNPTLSLGTSKLNTGAIGNSTRQGNGLWDRSYDTVAAISQLIEIGGKRSARKESAATGLSGARARFADARRILDKTVTQAYIAAVFADRNLQILSESAALLSKEADLAAVRQRAGDISLADQKRVEITASRFEIEKKIADAAAQTARVQLEFVLESLNPDGRLQLAESLEQLSKLIPGPLTADAVATAPTSRSDMVAAEAARAKAEAELRLQKAQRVPDAILSFHYEHEPPDKPNSVGFMVSLPVPLWNWNRGNIAIAESVAHQATIQSQKIAAQINVEILSAHVAFDTAQSRWWKYRDDLEPRSESVRKAVALAYQKGGASLLDLLTVERSDNEVRLATAQAAADAINSGAALRAALSLAGESNPK